MERQGAPLSEAEAALVLREAPPPRACSSPAPPAPSLPPPQVLTALRYLHVELRALHRDVKAANVLLTASGAARALVWTLPRHFLDTS